jgi:hypothetical protein
MGQQRRGPIRARALSAEPRLPGPMVAPGVYTLCFKFVGQRPSGSADKYISERVVFEAVDGSRGAIRALLAPHIDWSVSKSYSETLNRANEVVAIAEVE